MGIHGDNQFRVGALEDLLPDTLSFAANNHCHLLQFPLPQVFGPVGQSRDTNGNICFRAGCFHFFPLSLHHLGTEHRAHGGSDYLMAIGIGTAFQQHHGDIQGVGCP